MKVRAHQYDTVDALCWRHYGRMRRTAQWSLSDESACASV
ncbi:tail protein X [Escherichia coli]